MRKDMETSGRTVLKNQYEKETGENAYGISSQAQKQTKGSRYMRAWSICFPSFIPLCYLNRFTCLYKCFRYFC